MMDQLGHGGNTMEYTSNRLLLREFTIEDFNLFYSVFSNEQVMKYALMDNYQSAEQALPFWDNILNRKQEINRTAYEFAVFLLSDNRFIGFSDIEVHWKNEFGGCGEIGYFLLPHAWSQGYATEISKTLLDIGFRDLGLHRISARCNANNSRSESVMKKIGMVKEGEIRKDRFKDGHWDNELLYGIIKPEWELFNT